MLASSQLECLVVTVRETNQAIKASQLVHLYVRECEETIAATTRISGLIEHLSNSRPPSATLQKATLSTGKTRPGTRSLSKPTVSVKSLRQTGRNDPASNQYTGS